MIAPCGNCSAIQCDWNIVCDSISASRTKIGISAYQDGVFAEWTVETYYDGAGNIRTTTYHDDGTGTTVVYTTGGPTGDPPSTIYSEPYLTATLISKTVDDLPDYPGTFTGGCFASRELPDGDYSYSIKRTKGKLQHAPASDCFLKIWIRSRFVRDDGGPDELTDIDTYEWNGTGNPCWPDPTKGAGDVANLISHDLPELTEPDANGNLFYDIKKWSCVKGYEPDDPVDNDHGSTRPDPDLKPNGSPL